MAQPIAATPTLEGEDAVRFLKEVNKPPSPEKVALLKKIEKEWDVRKEMKIAEDVKEFLKPYKPLLFEYGNYDDLANGLVELIKKEIDVVFW